MGSIALAPLGEPSLHSAEAGNWSEQVSTTGEERRTGQAANCAKLVTNSAQLWAVDHKLKILKAKADGNSAIVHVEMGTGMLEVWYSFDPKKQRAVAEIWLIDSKGNQQEPNWPADNGIEMLKIQLRTALECSH